MSVVLIPGFADGTGNETIYDQIRGFVQLNANEVVVNDAGNGCLRHLDRTTGKTSTFAGLCNRFDRTHKDGTFSAARFSNIKFNIIRHHKRNSLFVLDGNNVIKELDLATKMVSSFLNIDSAGIRSLAIPWHIFLDPSEENFYLLTKALLAKINIATKAITLLTLATRLQGFQDGALSTAMLNSPSGLVFLNKDTILISDTSNRRLRVVNLITSTISSICTAPTVNPTSTHPIDGDIRTCTLSHEVEQPILYQLEENRVLIIGVRGGIRQLKVFKGKPEMLNKNADLFW